MELSGELQVTVVKRLISRGEDLCAMVCCHDWGLNYVELRKEVKNEREPNTSGN